MQGTVTHVSIHPSIYLLIYSLTHLLLPFHPSIQCLLSTHLEPNAQTLGAQGPSLQGFRILNKSSINSYDSQDAGREDVWGALRPDCADPPQPRSLDDPPSGPTCTKKGVHCVLPYSVILKFQVGRGSSESTHCHPSAWDLPSTPTMSPVEAQVQSSWPRW